MKKTMLFYIVLFGVCCAAQPPADPVPGKPFYTISYAGKVQEISMTGDSLRLGKEAFHIEGSEKKAAYAVLYVRRNFLVQPKIPVENYGLFVFRLSPDKDTLQVFENTRWFFTLDEAKKAVGAVASFEDPYFDVYYSQSAFAKLKKYPPVKSADKLTLQTITDQWAAAISDNRQKSALTSNDGIIYGHRAWQNSLTPLLVKYQLDPAIPLAAFDAQAKRAGVVFPASPNLRQGVRRITVTDSVREMTRAKADSTR